VNPCLAARHRAQARAPGVRGPGLATCVSARVAGDPWRAVRVQRRVDEPSRARWRVPRRAAVRFGHKRREGCASVYVGPYTEVGPRRARRGTQACAPCGRRRSSVRTKNLQAADARSRAAAHCSGRAVTTGRRQLLAVLQHPGLGSIETPRHLGTSDSLPAFLERKPQKASEDAWMILQEPVSKSVASDATEATLFLPGP
jgi:hypothetical protein